MFGENLRNTLSHLLGKGRASGADFVEFFIENRVFLNALTENGKVTSVSPSLSLGAGVRLFKGKEDCYVSTNDISSAGLEKILETALDIMNLRMTKNRIISDVNLEPLRDYGTLKNKNIWLESKPPVQLICDKLIESNLKQLKIKHIQSATTSAFHDCQEVLVASSDSVFARDIRLNHSIAAQVLCIDGEHKTSTNKRIGKTGKINFFDELKIDEFTHELEETAGQMLHADYVSSGEYPVVLANQFGGVIFHEACGHLLETTAVQRNSTPFADKKNELIAHENLTAWDEGFWENGFGSIDMDDEGMPSQKTLLIENGVLRNFLCDRMGNVLTGHPRTGSGRRQSYAYAPASRMRNTYIAPGVFTKEEMLSSISKGLYCKSLGGGSVSTTGEFNFAVNEGWLIENGKLTKPVKGATLIGQAPEVMKKISMCGKDLDVSGGFCGSVSGSIYVTVGQPHIKVDSMTVGGR